MRSKVCTQCGVKKDKSQFAKRNNRKVGIQPYCKRCRREQQRKGDKSAYRKKPTGVYVWRDRDGVARYVGISTDLAKRTAQHHNSDAVWTDYAVAPTEFVQVFPTFDEAAAAEELMIKAYVDAGVDLVNRTHNARNSSTHYIDTVEKMRVVHKQHSS